MLKPTVSELVARMKIEILKDMLLGIQPRGVTSFAELHDHVDANYYGGLLEDDCPLDPSNEADLDIIEQAQYQVHLWLEGGRKDA